MSIVTEKQNVRQHIKEAKQAFSLAMREKESAYVWEMVEQHPLFQKSQTVLLFHSLPDEPATPAFIEKWSKRKRILLPVVDGDVLQLRDYSPTISFSTGAFGIQEPMGENLEDYHCIDFAIIPGVAFDREGYRLGRGKGYYDRLLCRPDFQAYTLGVGFSFQILEAVPTEATDRKLNEIVDITLWKHSKL